jgi:hypothetical protein
MTMLNETDLRDLMTRDVVDPEGKSVGNVETFFKDRASGRPEWLGVYTGTIRSHHYLVPVEGAEREGTVLRVPWTKEQVHSAPSYRDPDEPISEEMEREAYRHYGLQTSPV